MISVSAALISVSNMLNLKHYCSNDVRKDAKNEGEVMSCHVCL